MRKIDYINELKLETPLRTLNKDYVKKISETWNKYGYDHLYHLDENDDLYDILEKYRPNVKDLKRQKDPKCLGEAAWGIMEDFHIYKYLLGFCCRNLCGFYDVSSQSYMSPDLVCKYAELWNPYSTSVWEEWEDKSKDFFVSIAARIIAQDVTDFLDGKRMYNARITKKNLDLLLKHGPFIGRIFDPDEGYRKPKNFEEYALYTHSDFWFNDPNKGYRINAKYKWNPAVPTPSNLV